MSESRNIAALLSARENAAADARGAGEPENLLGHAWKYPVAVLGDLGQTVVNSGIALYNLAVPESIEGDYVNRYAFMSNDVAEYTRQNKAAVELGSFLAGAVLPAAGVGKAMALARTGTGAFGYTYRGIGLATFDTKIKAAAASAVEAATNAGVQSTAYRTAINSGKLWTGAEAVAENVLYEAGLVMAMNQHSYFDEGWNPTLGIGGIAVGSAVTGMLKWAKIAKEIKVEGAMKAQLAQTDLIETAAGRNPFTTATPVLRGEYGEGTILEITKEKLTDLTRAENYLSNARITAAPEDPLFGQRSTDILRGTRMQAEQEALDSLNRLVPEGYTKGIMEDETLRVWELRPTEPAVVSTTASQAIDPDRFKYAMPEQGRLAFNYLMGQPRQALGVTKVTPGIGTEALETTLSPYRTVVPGSVDIRIDNTFHEMVSLVSEGRIARIPQAMPAGVYGPVPAPVYARPANFTRLDKAARYKYDPITNTHEFDLSNIRTKQDRLAYLAYQIDAKGAQNLRVHAGPDTQKWMDSTYKKAAKIAASRVRVGVYASTAEVRRNLPKLAVPFQTISWWDGKPLMRDSIEAHMTKTAIEAVDGNVTALKLRAHEGEWQRAITLRSASAFKTSWSPVELVGRKTMPIATAQADLQFLQAGHGARAINSMDLREVPIDPTDLPKLQAAFVHGLHVTNFASNAALGQKLIDVKIENMRSLLKATPDLSPLELSILTNTPTETVRHVLTGLGRDTTMPVERVRQLYARTANPMDWIVYGASTTYDDGAKFTTSAIRGRAQHSISGTAIAARLDNESLEDITKELIDNIAAPAASRSQLVSELHSSVVRTPAMEVLRQQLTSLSADAGMGSMGGSVDFTLRNYDGIVAAATQTGKQLETANNAAIKRMEEALTPTAMSLIRSEPGVVQYEYVRNALAALGSKDFDRKGGLVFEPNTNRIILRPGSPTTAPEYLTFPGTQQAIEVLPEVRSHLEATEQAAKELFVARDTIRQFYGRAATVDRRNFWFPSPSLEHAAQAFIRDTATGKTSRIISNSLEELNTEVAKFRAEHAAEIANGKLTIFMRNEQELGTWMRIHGQMELENAINPIPTMRRSGIASNKVTGNPAIIDEVISGFRREYTDVSRQYARAANQDILRALDNIESIHNSAAAAGNPKSPLIKTQARVSPATVAKAALLNTSLQKTSPALQAVDDMFSIALDSAATAVRKGYQHYQQATKRGQYNAEAFQEILTGLRKHNIPIPWADELHYAISNTPELKPVAKDIVAAHNSVVATLALRLGELAHPLVTALTTPLVLTGELVAKQRGQGYTDALATMYRGARDWARYASAPRGTYPELEAIMETGKRLGHTQLRVSEATQTLAQGFGGKNWWQKMESSKAFEWLCMPSDFTERATREVAYLTGYQRAAKMAPQANPDWLHTQAALFTDRTMGNYTARQRPIFFQGSAGQALGLFQTFMWTMGQNLFRYAENGNMRAIAGVLGGYGGMFGLSSLPGWQFVDTALGEFSRDTTPMGADVDATQIIYRAFGDKHRGHERSAAEFMLYGVPSTLLQTALWTRGEIQPRLPVNSGGLPVPPAVSMYTSTLDTIMRTAGKMGSIAANNGSVGDASRALAEGVAMQYMWRPAARLAELSLGYAIDQKGETVLSGEDVRGPWPAMARVLGARPLKEQVIRNQSFRHKLYDSADQSRRSRLISAMRTVVRGDGDVTGFVAQYLHDGGSPEGVRQALNDAHFTADAPAAVNLLRQVSKQPGIAEIMEGYAF